MMRLYHPKFCQSESIQGFLLKEQEKAFWRHKISCFYEKFREIKCAFETVKIFPKIIERNKETALAMPEREYEVMSEELKNKILSQLIKGFVKNKNFSELKSGVEHRFDIDIDSMLSRLKYYVSYEKVKSFSDALSACKISRWNFLGLDEALTKKFAQMIKAIRDSSNMDEIFKVGVPFVVAQLLRSGMDWNSVNLMTKTKFRIDLNQFLLKTEENGEDVVLGSSSSSSAASKSGVKWNAESMENLIQKVNKSQLSSGVKARVIDLLKMTHYRMRNI